jgi:FAD/FMN-containing dehydrogenase
MLTQLYGLACDTIKGIEFVDATGVLQYADAAHNPDMYWLARGGGGNFPGIVTKFVVQAFDAPGVLTGKDCFYYTPEASKSLVKAWLSRLEEMSKPSHQMFTHIIFFNSNWIKFSNLCFDCSAEQLAWFENTIDDILDEVGEVKNCACERKTWFDQLLFEAGSHQGFIKSSPVALTDRHQGWGSESGPKRASKNGGYLSNTYEMPEEFFDTLAHWSFGEMDENKYAWDLMVMLYNMGGPAVSQVPIQETPYRGRDAKFVVHFKHQWNEGNAETHDNLMRHHQGMSQALEQHLPCEGFYNYMDGSLPCAGGDSDKWLEAYFADVPRMKAIKAAADPASVFRSRLTPTAASEPQTQPPGRRLQASLDVTRASGHAVVASSLAAADPSSGTILV